MMERLRNLLTFRRPEIPREVRGVVGYADSQLYGYPLQKYNPDDLIGRKGHAIYSNMMKDEQVKAVVKFRRDAITSRDYYLDCEDTDLSDSEAEKRIRLYTYMIERFLEGSLNDSLNYIMRAMYQGFSLTEIVYGVFDFDKRPWIGLQKLMPKPYDTFTFHTNRVGEITRVVQELDAQEQDINLDKFVYYVHNPEIDQHYGSSDLREAYRSWYSKDITIRFYNMFLERFGSGFVVARPKDGTTLARNSQAYQEVLAAIQSIQSQTAILLPSNIEVEMFKPQTTDQFEKSVQLHDLQIAKALLVPNLLGISHQGETGAFAQSNTQMEAFLWTLEADSIRLSDTINEQILNPLNEMNFADGQGPNFHFKPISERKRYELLKSWKELVATGAVEAYESDEDHIRDMLDFPEKSGAVIGKQPEHHNPPGSDTPNAPGQQPTPVGQGEDPTRTTDETVVGKPVRIVSEKAFQRAEKRTSTAVIDRKHNQLVDEVVPEVESALAGMLASFAVRVEEEKLGTRASEVQDLTKLDFTAKDKSVARKVIERSLKRAWDIGEKFATTEISSARREQFRADMDRIGDEAQEWLAANSFRMLGDFSDSMQAQIRTILMNGIKYSWTTRDIITKIYDSLVSDGFITTETAALATGRAASEVAEIVQSSGLAHRIRTAVITTTFEALNEARFNVFTDPALDGFVEALQYSAILDSRTTDICRHMHGRIYPASSTVWDTYRPPNHFNCRSLLIPVTVIDTEDVGKDQAEGSRWSRDPSKQPQSGFGGPTG